MGRIERQCIESVGLLNTAIDLEYQVGVRHEVSESRDRIARQISAGLQHPAAGLHCENFSIEMHESGLLDGSHAVHKGQVSERASIGVGFSHGKAIESHASFPEQGGEPSNHVKGILLGCCVRSYVNIVGSTSYTPTWADPDQELSPRPLSFRGGNVAESLQSRQGRGF